MAQVSLGNFFNVGGRTIVKGVGGSGLDTEALINALVEAKQLPAKKLQDSVDLNTKKLSALDEYKKYANALKDATNYLRNPSGVNNATDNAFEYRLAAVNSNTSVAGSTYLSATVAAGAAIQNYSITNITSIAAAKKQASEIFNLTNANTSVVVAAAPGASEFLAGTITVNGQNITLSAGDTLNQVAAKFNAVKNQTGITATVVQVTTGGVTNDFQINFASTKTGTAYDFDLKDPGTVTDLSGVLGNISINDTQQAANTEFELDGVSISRSTTSIGDVIDGVTFNFLQKPAGDPLDTTLDVAVAPDVTTAQNAIINFVNAFNDLKIFYQKQNELDSNGSLKDTAILSSSQALRSGMSNIINQISAQVQGLDSDALSTLGSLGLTFIDLPQSDDNPATRNVLTIDTEKLSSALLTKFDEVRSVFEFSQTSTNPNFKIYSRSNSLTMNELDVSVTVPVKQIQETSLFAVADVNTQVVFTTPGANQLGAGNFKFMGASFAFSDGDTLTDVAGKFNDKVSTTGVYADVVNVAPGQYKIVFTAANGGLDEDFDFNSSDLDDTDNVFDNVTIATTQAAADGIYEATYDDGSGPVTLELDGVSLGSSGFTLTGQAGTALEGLSIVYGGSTDQTTTINFTQGLADRTYNVITPITLDLTGNIDNEQNALRSNSERLQDEITRINEQVEKTKEVYLNRFAALEKAIQSVNNLLTLLDAQDKARQQAAS